MPKAGAKEPRKLTPRQERFCQRYTIHWNATRAAKEAGYSEKSAMELGYQVLQSPSVQARIQSLTDHALKEIGVSRERTLTELARIAYTNMKELARWTHSGVEFHTSEEVSEEAAASISEVSETVTQAGGTLKIKQHDKVKALELLGRYQKLFADRIEHSGPNGGAIETRDLSDVPDDELNAKIAALISERKPEATE